MIRYLRDRNYRSVKPVGEGGEQCKAEREGDAAGGTATKFNSTLPSVLHNFLS